MNEEQRNVNETEAKVEGPLKQPLTQEVIANNPGQEMTEVAEEKAIRLQIAICSLCRNTMIPIFYQKEADLLKKDTKKLFEMVLTYKKLFENIEKIEQPRDEGELAYNMYQNSM
uniref:Uncharacterized protein n=1 Tax=Acrobeloides nanus TaxID=290746 RepID=A0A914CNI8_9BILA